MNTVAFYDAEPYDRECFERAPEANRLRRQYHEFRLTSETVASVDGAQAVCVFVNDRLDTPCLTQLQRAGVRLVDLRCAGFNNVDLTAAKSLGIAVTRVPAYSPHAVAEQAVALLLTLNRKIHRAFNRVRELHGKTVGIIGTGKIGRITAHRAFLTRESLEEIARVTTANLVRLAEGQPFPEESILMGLPSSNEQVDHALRRGVTT